MNVLAVKITILKGTTASDFFAVRKKLNGAKRGVIWK